jgi:hypothetical protein
MWQDCHNLHNAQNEYLAMLLSAADETYGSVTAETIVNVSHKKQLPRSTR